MARDEKIDLLRSVPLFHGLRDRELERISALADIIDIRQNRRLMTQGERGAEMFILITGAARVERDGAVLADGSQGEVLGEIALLDGGPRTATVTLTEPSRLLVLGTARVPIAYGRGPGGAAPRFDSVSVGAFE